MNVVVATALSLVLSQAAAAQTAERKNGAIIAADFDYRSTLDRCALHRQGVGAAVVAKLFVRFQPDQRLAAGDGIEIVVTGDDDLPTVTAHAINTKGSGAQNGRGAVQACGLEPAPRGTLPTTSRTTAEAASCAISGGADTTAAAFTLPLAMLAPDAAAKNYVGHVTLIKRGDDAGSAKIVAACTSSGALRASYDLVVGKKV